MTLRAALEDELRNRIEIYVLLSCLAVWYISAIGGAFTVDESIYAETGYALFRGNPYLNPTHMFAPTVKYFIGLGQLALGRTAFGVRLPVIVFALLCVYLTYVLGKGSPGAHNGNPVGIPARHDVSLRELLGSW
jgi:4-amino-4-deoxy-L-arabinose transferase-like glycosyltransferase